MSNGELIVDKFFIFYLFKYENILYNMENKK